MSATQLREGEPKQARPFDKLREPLVPPARQENNKFVSMSDDDFEAYLAQHGQNFDNLTPAEARIRLVDMLRNGLIVGAVVLPLLALILR